MHHLHSEQTYHFATPPTCKLGHPCDMGFNPQTTHALAEGSLFGRHCGKGPRLGFGSCQHAKLCTACALRKQHSHSIHQRSTTEHTQVIVMHINAKQSKMQIAAGKKKAIQHCSAYGVVHNMLSQSFLKVPWCHEAHSPGMTCFAGLHVYITQHGSCPQHLCQM